MKTVLQARCVPWTIPDPSQVSGPGTQPSHWPHITAIPCQVRRLLRDCTKEADRPGCPRARMEIPERFCHQKGQPKSSIRGPLGDLLAP